jgi:hypothetical protein
MQALHEGAFGEVSPRQDTETGSARPVGQQN